MPRFIIHHVTKYSYPEPVRDSTNQIMLFPVKDEFQELESQQLVITGYPNLERYVDYYGNNTATFMYVESHSEMLIDSKVEVITKPIPLPLNDKPAAEQWANLEQIKFIIPYIDFLKQEYFSDLNQVMELTEIKESKTKTVFDAINQLNTYVYKNFKYIKGITNIETTLDEIWKLKAGVCQDFAHMLLAIIRLIGVPARYVSGYVCPQKQDLRGDGATHAWIEAYIPFYGWLGFDPTNNCIVSDQHVRLAIGRSFTDCSPVRGTYKGTAKQTLEVGVSVSFEDGTTPKALNSILQAQPQPLAQNAEPSYNSYRRHMEMMQQQQ